MARVLLKADPPQSQSMRKVGFFYSLLLNWSEKKNDNAAGRF